MITPFYGNTVNPDKRATGLWPDRTRRKVSRAIIVGAGLSEVPMPATSELVWTLGIVFFVGASLISRP